MPALPITALQIPSGFCPTSYQDLWNMFAANGVVNIPSSSSQIVQQSSPPADQSSVWVKTDSLGRPIGVYIFAQGAWLSPHAMKPGMTIWWFNTLPDFTSFDGGDGNTVSSISGPMWQQAVDINGTLIAAQFPVAQGTFPSGTVLTLGVNGGEEKHLLLTTEGAQDPIHTHVEGRMASNSGTSGDDGYFFTVATSNVTTGNARGIHGNSNTQTQDISNLSGDYIQSGIINPTPAAVLPHGTVPPYVVGYLLQRTARLFLVG